MGYTAVPQVGVSNYSIDIGIKHPDYPFGYLCGIECDGATIIHRKVPATGTACVKKYWRDWVGIFTGFGLPIGLRSLGQSRKVKQYLDELLSRRSKTSPAD